MKVRNIMACAASLAGRRDLCDWLEGKGGVDGDGLRRIAMAITAETGAACCALAPGGQGLAYALAAAPGGDVRAACKALNEAFAGRGGGKPAFCQGSLADADEKRVRAFLKEIL